jgi:hypothetical protein
MKVILFLARLAKRDQNGTAKKRNLKKLNFFRKALAMCEKVCYTMQIT